jgi:WD40 repeat protein
MASDDPVLSMDISHDGRLLATATRRGLLQLWEFQRLPALEARDDQPRQVSAVAFSAEGDTLVSASSDGGLNIIGTGNSALQWRRVKGAKSITHISFALNGRRFATQSPKSVQAWETDTGQRLETTRNTSKEHAAALSPDGQLLATYCPHLCISVVGGRSSITLPDSWSSYGPHPAAFSHCGKFLATADAVKIKVWDLIAQSSHNWFKCPGTTAMAFVPDYGIFASASRKNITLWRWPSGIKLRVLMLGWETKQLYFCPASLRLRTDHGTILLGNKKYSGGSEDLLATSMSDSFISGRWIMLAGERVVQLPLDYQKSIYSVHDTMAALGLSNGRTTMIEFDSTKLVASGGQNRPTYVMKWLEAEGQEGTDLFEMWPPSRSHPVRKRISKRTLVCLMFSGTLMLLLLGLVFYCKATHTC